MSKLVPNLYFLVGNDKTLENYQQYQCCFLEKVRHFDFQSKNIQGLVGLSAEINMTYQHNPSDTLLPISCFPNEYIRLYSKDSTYGIYYNNYLKLIMDYSYKNSSFKKDTNIFEKNPFQNFVHYKGIKDTLSFPIHINDSFITKILISIAIYKKNNQKTSLSNEDYRYIFHELFREDVDIQSEIKKDIPKTLKYIPRDKN